MAITGQGKPVAMFQAGAGIDLAADQDR